MSTKIVTQINMNMEKWKSETEMIHRKNLFLSYDYLLKQKLKTENALQRECLTQHHC